MGYTALRIWVNQTVTDRIYFGNYATQNFPIASGASAGLDVCGSYDASSSDNINQSLYSHFDAMNFVWFQGSEGLYQNHSGSRTLFAIKLKIDALLDPTCMLSGFLSPKQRSCFICRPGYYLQDNICVSQPSTGYFLDNATQSYHSKKLMHFKKIILICNNLECYYGQYFVNNHFHISLTAWLTSCRFK